MKLLRFCFFVVIFANLSYLCKGACENYRSDEKSCGGKFLKYYQNPPDTRNETKKNQYYCCAYAAFKKCTEESVSGRCEFKEVIDKQLYDYLSFVEDQYSCQTFFEHFSYERVCSSSTKLNSNTIVAVFLSILLLKSF